MDARELLLRYDSGERDFRNVDLSGERLTQANLTGALLVGTDLNGACLHQVELAGACLSGAH